MIYKTVTGVLFILMIASTTPLAFGQSLGHKSSKSRFHSGQSKYPTSNKGHGFSGNTNLFNKHQQLHNKHYVSPKDFHNKHYQPIPGTKAYEQKYYGKQHYYKSHNKRYNYYGHKPYNQPYGGYVYYGYNNYYPDDYYVYEDVPYDGYGSTLGTVPRRPNNLDVNNYVYGPDYDSYEPGYDPEEQYEYPDVYEEPLGDYSNAPGSANRAIYVWTDNSGVEHFVNDPDIVPDEFWSQVRVVEEY
jgi:hypothetical protein